MLGEALTSTRDAPLEGMLYWVAYAATGIELLAVAVIVVVIVFATVSYAMKILARQADKTTYTDFRHRVGRALLLGLEILVAADIIRTIVLEPTLANVLDAGLARADSDILELGTGPRNRGALALASRAATKRDAV